MMGHKIHLRLQLTARGAGTRNDTVRSCRQAFLVERDVLSAPLAPQR